MIYEEYIKKLKHFFEVGVCYDASRMIKVTNNVGDTVLNDFLSDIEDLPVLEQVGFLALIVNFHEIKIKPLEMDNWRDFLSRWDEKFTGLEFFHHLYLKPWAYLKGYKVHNCFLLEEEPAIKPFGGGGNTLFGMDFQGTFEIQKQIIGFKNDDDAMLFKLTFGGTE